MPPSDPIVGNPLVLPPAPMPAGFAAVHPPPGHTMPQMFGGPTLYSLPINANEVTMMQSSVCPTEGLPQPYTYAHASDTQVVCWFRMVNRSIGRDPAVLAMQSQTAAVEGISRQQGSGDSEDAMKRRRNTSTPRSPEWDQFFDGRQLNLKREEIVRQVALSIFFY